MSSTLHTLISPMSHYFTKFVTWHFNMALVLSFDEVFQGDEDGEAEDPVTCASVNISVLYVGTGRQN